MRLNEVINRFTLVSGLEDAEVSKWSVLCSDAMQELSAQLLPDAEKKEGASLRLSNCAGVLAYYKYCLYNTADRVRSFTAGSVSVNIDDNTLEHARLMWEQERKGVADLLCDESSFCFRRVRI